MAISYGLVSKQRGGMFLGAKPTLKSLSPRAALPSASFFSCTEPSAGYDASLVS